MVGLPGGWNTSARKQRTTRSPRTHVVVYRQVERLGEQPGKSASREAQPSCALAPEQLYEGTPLSFLKEGANQNRVAIPTGPIRWTIARNGTVMAYREWDLPGKLPVGLEQVLGDCCGLERAERFSKNTSKKP